MIEDPAAEPATFNYESTALTTADGVLTLKGLGTHVLQIKFTDEAELKKWKDGIEAELKPAELDASQTAVRTTH
jgi:hypothetical protein